MTTSNYFRSISRALLPLRSSLRSTELMVVLLLVFLVVINVLSRSSTQIEIEPLIATSTTIGVSTAWTQRAIRTRKFITSWSPKEEKPNNHRIYFHGARGNTELAMIRQSCAVESAARHNPGRPIELFISTDDPDGYGLPLSNSTDPWLTILKKFHNVAIIVYNETEYFSGSPFEDWHQEGLWRQSPHQGQVHLSDYWRMLSSYRGGGFYMDLDVITMKPLDEKKLWNFFSLEDRASQAFCSGIFHMEHGHWLVSAIIRQLAAKRYNPNIYNAYGPLFVKKMLTTHCGLVLPDVFTNTCPDVKILSNQFFFPIPWPEWETYFKEVNDKLMRSLNRDSYGVHVWNKLSGNHTLVKGSKELYSVLAQEHCPLTYSARALDSHHQV